MVWLIGRPTYVKRYGKDTYKTVFSIMVWLIRRPGYASYVEDTYKTTYRI